MTISKERLNEIALEVASKLQGLPEFFNSEGGFEWTLFHKAFVRALLKAVEAESEIVGYLFLDHDEMLFPKDIEKKTFAENPEYYTKLIALPLVELEE